MVTAQGSYALESDTTSTYMAEVQNEAVRILYLCTR